MGDLDRRLETAHEQRGQLLRHPNDGWQMADPYPMGKGTRRALAGLVRALTPAEHPVPDVQTRVEHHIRVQMRYMVPVVAFGMLLLIRFLDWAPLWRFASWRRVQSLPPERGSEILDSIAHSRIGLLRMMIMGIRAMVGTCFYDQDEVHAQLNYDPIPWMKQRIALRERLLAGETTQPNDRIGPYSDVRMTGEGPDA